MEREQYDYHEDKKKIKKQEKLTYFFVHKWLFFRLKEKEEKNLAHAMMTKKQKRILRQINYGKDQKKKEKMKLEEKAKTIKKEKQKSTGKNNNS